MRRAPGGRGVRQPPRHGPGAGGDGAAAPAGPPPVAVLLYPGCIFLEVAPAVELLAAQRRLCWLTPDGRPHAASNGARLQADADYARGLAQPLSAVLVPGGDPASILEPGLAAAGLREAHARGALLAGICAGALVLAGAGLLRGRRGTHNYTLAHTTAEVVACTAPFFDGLHFEDADLVLDGRVLTAQHWAAPAFALAVARELGVLDAHHAQRLAGHQRRGLAATLALVDSLETAR